MAADELTPQPETQFPLYLQPNADGTHQTLINGQIHDIPFDAMTPQLQMQALQAAQPPPQKLASSFWGNEPGPGTFGAKWKEPSAPTNDYQSIMARASQGETPIVDEPATAQPEAPAEQPPTPKPAAYEQTGPTTVMAPTADQLLGKAPAAATGAGGGGGGEVKALNDAEQLQEKGIKLNAKTEQETAEEKAAVLSQQMQSEQAARDSMAVKQAAVENSKADMIAKATAAAERFQNATIDPNSVWNHKDTGQKMQAGLAMLLSGLGSGVTGQANMAVKSMEDAQTRDLEAQRFNIQHNKEVSEQFRALYQDYRQTGLDNNTALDATIASIKAKADQQNQMVVLQHGGEAALSKFMTDTASARVNHVNNVATILNKVADTAEKRVNAAHTAAETAQLGIQAGLTRDLKAGQQNLSKGYGFDQLPPEQQRAVIQNAQASKMLVPGVGIAQREVSPADQDKAQDITTARNLMSDIARETKGAGGIWSAKAASKAQALKAILPKVLGSQARINEGTSAVLDNIISGSRFLPGWEQGAKQKALKSTLGEIEKNFHKSLGLTPFQRDRTDEEAAALGAVAQR